LIDMKQRFAIMDDNGIIDESDDESFIRRRWQRIKDGKYHYEPDVTVRGDLRLISILDVFR
jgi:hypothetical protein